MTQSPQATKGQGPTRADRETAWLAIGAALPAAHAYAERFLETGADPDEIYPITARIADAITSARESAKEPQP